LQFKIPLEEVLEAAKSAISIVDSILRLSIPNGLATLIPLDLPELGSDAPASAGAPIPRIEDLR